MKNYKGLLGLSVGVLSVISISDICNIQKVKAELVHDTNSEQAVCRKFYAGTYLTTISDSTGKFASRSIITLNADGNILINDSNEGGVYQGGNQYNPFTSSQGAWNCDKNGTITATTLNLNLSGPLPIASNPLGIAGQKYQVTVSQDTQTLQGKIDLRFFDLNATLQEATGTSSTPSVYTFTGQRVTVK